MGGATSDGVVIFGFICTLEVLEELDELVELDEPEGITIGIIAGILGDLHFPLI